MKELLQQAASYHLWANQRLIERILLLTGQQQRQQLLSSFPSLFEMLTHMHNVDIIWWQRMKQMEMIIPTKAIFEGGIILLTERLIEQDTTWQSWVNSASDINLSETLQYRNTMGRQFNQPVYQVLAHLFNHGTYHRGQLVAMLHQLAVPDIPATDFIVWSRE